MNPRALLAEIRKRPLLVIGGLVALFAIANLGDLFGRGKASDETPAEPPPDPNADPAVTDPSIGADQAGFMTPTYNYPSYDPFAVDQTTNQPVVELSPEGCRLPRPATPSAYTGLGEYKCDAASKSWVWTWGPAKVSPKGCLLPKPAVPAQYTGRGDYECDAATKQWVWKWKETTPPPSSQPGRLVLPAGGDPTYKVNTSVTPKVASDVRAWQHSAVTLETSAKVSVRLPNGQTGSLVQIKSGSHAGRWMKVSAGAFTAPMGG